MCTYCFRGCNSQKGGAKIFIAPMKTKRHQEKYKWRFHRLQNTKQGRSNVHRGKIRRNYAWLMSLVIKKQNSKKRLVVFENKL